MHCTNYAGNPEEYYRKSISILFLDYYLDQISLRFLNHRTLLLKMFLNILPSKCTTLDTYEIQGTAHILRIK